MTQAKIDRINELARKSKNEGLNDAEKEEQQILRKEYVEAYRQSLRTQLENTVVVRPDGSRERLSDMKKKK
ncbi:MAG: DUF896 domain-containing protein [Ruminococcaceae bacterium]|nr:DUF896 domain-containing protein [Oscillospiraceae bacterium]